MQSQQQQQHAHTTHPLPPRTTPGRRRGANRHFVNSPARKTYASENDMPTSAEYPFPIDLASPLPLTPQRQARNSPGPASQSANPRSKPRTASKQKQKQVSTSPEDNKYGRTTPPPASQPVMPKSAAAAVFAGATFHASPAPSSLPIPSFLAKALDSPGVKDTRRENQEPSPPPTDTEAPTPQHRILATEKAREESPLDIFFRADRAEKERARRASSANIFSTVSRPFSPPRQPPQSPQEARTVPNGVGSQRVRRPPGSQRTTSSGISSVELDGTPGKPMGPSFSTPYQERIRAARSNQKQHQQPQISQEKTPPRSPPEQDSVSELSDKLKRFLAIPMEPMDGNIQQARPVQTNATTNTSTAVASATFASPSNGVQPFFGRYTPGQAPPISANQGGQSRAGNVLDMENSLRRMLKIDAGISLGGATPSPASYQSS